MSGYIVYVRFFLGYTSEFAFEEFFTTKDDEIEAIVERLRKQWWNISDNRKQVQKARADLKKKQRQWNAAFELEKEIPTPPKKPSFDEIAHAAGWKSTSIVSPDLTHGISKCYAIRRFETQEDADDAAEILQNRVKELALAADQKNEWTDKDDFFATANPRFFVAAESSLTRAELATTNDKIERLKNATGLETIEAKLLRSYIPQIRGALDQIESVINQNSQETTDSKTEGAQTGADFEFIEGGYILWGVEADLIGYPLAVLKTLAYSRKGRVSAKELLDEIWDQNFVSDQAVKDAVTKARASLRRALNELGAKGYGNAKGKQQDPIRCVDTGKNLAWKLNLPPRPNSIEKLR